MQFARSTGASALALGQGRTALRGAAIVLALAFACASLVTALYGSEPGPKIGAFLPICATLWMTSDALTAALLASQFYVGGRISLLLLASGYAFCALLTIPYLAFFPGYFSDAGASGAAAQISMYLTAVWHVAFPLTIGFAHAVDPSLDRVAVARANVVTALRAAAAATVAAAVAVTALVAGFHAALPPLADGAHFTPLWSHAVAPLIFFTSVAAFVVVTARLRNPGFLQVWIAVALLASATDGLLNATALGRYSIAWYVGKTEALISSTAVLWLLLHELSKLHRRLFEVATTDALTGLANRRALERVLDDLAGDARLRANGFALLVLDLDHFKAVNDAYGHPAGDRVLRAVAGVIEAAAFGPGDLALRYGGEEFVVVLADTSLAGARDVAERIRETIASRPIPLDDGRAVRVTASVGIAHAAANDRRCVEELFRDADLALFAAKRGGRNRVVALEPAREERIAIA
jgi:diguanylate cyclase (GGDEF)-like protein